MDQKDLTIIRKQSLVIYKTAQVKYKIKRISNIVRKMRFWNNLYQLRFWNNLHQLRFWNNLHRLRFWNSLHQLRSNSKDWKAK
jgi:hypothetical protein